MGLPNISLARIAPPSLLSAGDKIFGYWIKCSRGSRGDDSTSEKIEQLAARDRRIFEGKAIIS